MRNLVSCFIVIFFPIYQAVAQVPSATNPSPTEIIDTIIWSDGTRYEGGVVDGKREGEGTIFWEDGTRFEGVFSEDQREGPGSLVLSDGTTYEGIFEADLLVEIINDTENGQVADEENPVLEESSEQTDSPEELSVSFEVADAPEGELRSSPEATNDLSNEASEIAANQEETFSDLGELAVLVNTFDGEQELSVPDQEPEVIEEPEAIQRLEELASEVVEEPLLTQSVDSQSESIAIIDSSMESTEESAEESAEESDDGNWSDEQVNNVSSIDDQPQLMSSTEALSLTADEQAEITSVVNLWARAWSDKDISTYFNRYSQDFIVPDGLSRSAWEALRARRIRAPGSIAVEVEFSSMELYAPNIPDLVDVYLIQHYSSDNYSDTSLKLLRLRKESQNWKIISEEELEALDN